MSIYFIDLPLCEEPGWGHGIRGYLMGTLGLLAGHRGLEGTQQVFLSTDVEYLLRRPPASSTPVTITKPWEVKYLPGSLSRIFPMIQLQWIPAVVIKKIFL